MQKPILTIFIFIFLFSPAQAAPIISTNNKINSTNNNNAYNINIPKSVKGLIDQNDLKQVFCYEAKYQGGKAIANIEAIHDVLANSLSKLEDLNIKINLDKYLSSTKILRTDMDNICTAKNLEQAKIKADIFKNEAENIKNDLQENLAPTLTEEIKNKISEQEKNLRKKFKAEMQTEADKIVDTKKSDYEKMIRSEAAKEQAKMQIRIQKEIEKELQKEYAGQKNINISMLKKIGKARGMAKGEAEKKNVEQKLRIKYNKLASEETKKLKILMEKRGEEKKQEIEKLYGDFSDIDKKIQELKEKKYKQEWEKFHKLALEAKMATLKKIIKSEFKNAKDMVKTNKKSIDMAHRENMNGNYSVPSAESLLREIETDQGEIISLFLDNDMSGRKIKKIKTRFTEKWKKIRNNLEKTKYTAPTEVLKRIMGKTNWQGLKNKLVHNQKHAKNIEKNYYKDTSWCNKNPKAKTNGKDIMGCARCRTLTKEQKTWFNTTVKIDKQITPLILLIDKLNTIKNNLPNLQSILKFKNELQTAINNLRAEQKIFKTELKQYESALKFQQKICATYK